MLIFIAWLVFSFIVASFGKDRKIGYGTSLAVALILSPLIGFIVVALSDRKNSGSTDSEVYKSDIDKYYESGKKHQYKDEYAEALESYSDAIFYMREKANLSFDQKRDKLTAIRAEMSTILSKPEIADSIREKYSKLLEKASKESEEVQKKAFQKDKEKAKYELIAFVLLFILVIAFIVYNNA